MNCRAVLGLLPPLRSACASARRISSSSGISIPRCLARSQTIEQYSDLSGRENVTFKPKRAERLVIS